VLELSIDHGIGQFNVRPTTQEGTMTTYLFPETLADHEVRAIYLQSAKIAIRRREFSGCAQSAPLNEVPSGSKVWRS